MPDTNRAGSVPDLSSIRVNVTDGAGAAALFVTKTRPVEVATHITLPVASLAWRPTFAIVPPPRSAPYPFVVLVRSPGSLRSDGGPFVSPSATKSPHRGS